MAGLSYLLTVAMATSRGTMAFCSAVNDPIPLRMRNGSLGGYLVFGDVGVGGDELRLCSLT